jgi:hypothetical protein
LISRFNTGLKLEKIKEDQLNIVLETLDIPFSDIPKLIDSLPINLFNKNLLKEVA